MSLRFIYGRAGSGKSYFCYNDIKRKIDEKSGGNLVLLVPEDYSFQAEKELLHVVGEKGIMQAKVLSFKRMAYSVFREVGGLARRHMNDTGRSMLLYRIMDEVKDGLTVFSKAVKLQGFVNTMSEIITELKVYGIEPEALNKASEKIEDISLKNKLNDIGLIFSKFESTLHLGYIDSEDDLSMLVQKMDKCSMFDGAEVWVDGFSILTPQQLKVMEKLLIKARRVNITLCAGCTDKDASQRKVDLFTGIRGVEDRILKIMQDNNIAFDEPVNLECGPCYKFKDHPELDHLERNIYSYPFNAYNDKTVHINLFKAANRYSEVEDTARDIIRLCRDQNFRFSDIAVISSDMEGYERLISSIFSEYDIPHFLDKKRDISGNPLIVLVLSALEILSKNWQYEPVFRYLKTGLLGLDDEDIDILENYVLSAGIKGRRWTDGTQWSFWPDYGGEGELTEETKEILKRVNETRETITAPLKTFFEDIKDNRKARDIAKALFDFLETLKAYDRILELVGDFRENGEHDLANEYSKVWNMLADTLDQIVEVLGDQEMTLDEFLKVLSIGFGECKVGLIPPTLDQVMFGSVEGIKSHSVKALYILGANEGLFPSSSKDEGVLNDEDRENLKFLGLELAPGRRESAFDEMFLIYTAFTRTNGYLRISYPIADLEGKSLRPSMVITKLKKIFQNITEYSNVLQNDSDEQNLRYINGPVPTFNSLVSSIRKSTDGENINPIWQDVHRWYDDSPDWKTRMERMASGLCYKNQVGNIDEERVRNLYGKNIRLSISRLEKFAGCPFSYFMQYGLRAKERKIYELSAPDLGTFMHKILDNFSKHLDDNNKKWRDLQRDECLTMVSKIVDNTVDQTSGSILSSSARYKYLKERLKRVMFRAVWLISQHIKKGGFESVDYEVSFEHKGKYPPISLNLDSGEKISLGGRIDRVDMYESEEGVYVRIVDYKSGNKSFDLSDIYNGLELQLLIYLDAILEHISKTSKKPVFPGGILYFRIDDPIINSGRELTEEEAEKEIMKELKMRGLLLSDVKVVREMDREMGSYSIILPAMIKNDGTFGSNSSVASDDDFKALRKHVKDKIIGLCNKMLQGSIEINPYMSEKSTPCNYCSFKAVCRFDSNMEENKYRKIKRYKSDEVWSAVRGKTSEGGGF